MSTEDIKNRLQVYIEAGDEKLLKLLYIVAREYNNENDLQLSEEEIHLLEERWERYKNGESKGYSWDEVIEIIGKNKKAAPEL
jgi:hypothetical protein